MDSYPIGVNGIKRGVGILVVALFIAAPEMSEAHWCSNIYNTYARIVVKPERNELNIGDGETGTLIVKVRNNFPYTLEYLKLTSDQPTGLTVVVTPYEKRPLYTGEESTFTLNITRNGGPDHNVSALNLSIKTEVESYLINDDNDEEHKERALKLITQDLTPDTVLNGTVIDREKYDPSRVKCEQYCELNYDKLIDLESNNCGTMNCDEVGISKLLGTYWKAGTNDCRGTSFDSQDPQEYLRAGLSMSARLRFRDLSAAYRQQIINSYHNAMNSPNEITRGIAAFYAAYGSNDSSITTRIQRMATDDTPADPNPPVVPNCSFQPNNRARRMAKAALLLHGFNDQYEADVISCANDTGEEKRVRAVCAAALGINAQTINKDNPITGFLLGYVPTGGYEETGESGSSYGVYGRLIGSALLQMVVLVRRGGPDGVAVVSFYPEQPIDDNVAPKAPTNLQVQAAY